MAVTFSEVKYYFAEGGLGKLFFLGSKFDEKIQNANALADNGKPE